ncbi:MAG: diguanylate cyclase response regulator [Proteobacteria bacterium]|nr:MAG: diguanylate cyclase response regulator [Pseudomonadota bacterium]
MATVLVIDDSESVRAELTSVLEASGLFSRVLVASDGIAGLRLLLQESMDVVICDLELPGLDGEKLLLAQRARPEAEDTPFFFVTADRDPDRMARLLRAGAADTILKPFHPAELIARVETHLRLRRLRAELREKNAILEKLSTTDPVTGLRSRRYVRDVLALEVLRAARYRAPLAVVMADLDHFKRINDGHGHLAGDAVLEATAGVVLERLRLTDVAGRYGGEEIILVLPQTDLDGAVALAEQLRIAVATNACRFGAAQLRVTLSLGVAEFVAGDDGDRLIEAADAALYEAKGAGRNCVMAAQRRAGVDTPVGKSRPVPRAGRKR